MIKICVALAALALFTACYKTGDPASVNGPAPDSPTSTIRFEDPPPTVPTSPIPDPVVSLNCLTATNTSLCLFQKNPVAQTRAALGDDTTAGANLAGLQTYAASLGPAHTTTLENSFVRVQRFDSLGLTNPAAGLKIPYSEANAGDLGLVLTYYWFNYAAQALIERTGKVPLVNRKITVYVDDVMSGWSGKRNSLHLARRGAKLATAFDASSLVYLMGVANADIASGGALGNDAAAEVTHTACANGSAPARQKACCKTADGCARALLSGAGEYFHALVFPNAPALGELLANDPAGLVQCGLPRNLAAYKDLTALAAFNACAGEGRPGRIQVMGALYASILWEIRKKTEATFPGSSRDFDRLFIDHLAQLSSEDTLASAKTKLLYVNQTIYGGRFDLMIRDEFQRRGL